MNRSLVLGFIGLSVAVILVLFVRRDVSTDTGTAPPRADSSSSPAGSKPMEDRPRPLELGRSASGASTSEEPGSAGAKDAKDAKSRADLDRYHRLHRSSVGSTGPRHPGSADSDGSAPNVNVRSQIDEVSRRSDQGESGTRRGGAANRAVIDDWAGVETGGDPANVRQPEEGEVLSLFEGDPIASQNEAAVAKEVTLDDDGAKFTPESEFAVPMAGKLTGEAGTLSFWVRPDGETADSDNASLVQLRSQYEWNNRLQIWKDGTNVRMVFADGNGVETGATYGSESWGPDEWRLVTVTWGDRLNAMYVNGELAGSAQYEGGFKILPNTLLHVGSNYSDSPSSLNGAVSQFRVYNRALTPEEVAALPSQYPE